MHQQLSPLIHWVQQQLSTNGSTSPAAVLLGSHQGIQTSPPHQLHLPAAMFLGEQQQSAPVLDQDNSVRQNTATLRRMAHAQHALHILGS